MMVIIAHHAWIRKKDLLTLVGQFMMWNEDDGKESLYTTTIA